MTHSSQVDFSLILCTKNRSAELSQFLDSLQNASEASKFELIVVDQNEDDRAKEIIERYKFPAVSYHQVSFSGLSRARNYGIRFTKGEYVAFPDDDCVYSPGILDEVLRFFKNDAALTGISGLHVENFHGELRPMQPVRINRYNVWTKSISYTLFFRASDILNQNGTGEPLLFNEALGVGGGTIWGSGEETDYVLKLLESNKKLVHVPTIRVAHPYIQIEREGECDKAYRYSRGRMEVLKIHRYPLWFKYLNIAYPLFKMLFHPNAAARRRFYYMQLLGRIHGNAR